MRVLGIAIASGALQYGALQSGAEISLPVGAPERLGRAGALTGSNLLADTFQRVHQDIHGLAPDFVVLVATRKYGNWAYRQAADRASLETLVHLACHKDGIQCEEWTTERIGKVLDVRPTELRDLPVARLGLIDRPKYWNQGRGDAFAAALAVLTEATFTA